MKYLAKYTIIICALFLSFQLQAQKYGYVDTQKIITELPQVKEANANIDTYKTQFQKKGQEMLKSLQTKYQQLAQKRERGELSPVQLDEEANRLKEKEQELTKFERESQQKIYEKSESLLSPIRNEIQAAIDAVAAEKGLDFIFDYSTGFVLYADPSTDISSQVKTKLRLQP
jgi:outer membrane protein